MNQATEGGPRLIRGAIALCTVAIFVCVTVPSFFTFVERQVQREAQATLLDFSTSARAHFLRHGTYACGDCGVRPAGGSHFTYDFGDGRRLAGAGDIAACGGQPPGRQAADGYRAVAFATAGDRRRCDIWSIDETMQLVHRPEAAAEP